MFIDCKDNERKNMLHFNYGKKTFIRKKSRIFLSCGFFKKND